MSDEQEVKAKGECHIEYEIIEEDWQDAGTTECKNRNIRLWLVCGNAKYSLGYVISALSGAGIIHSSNVIPFETICKDGTVIKYYEE